MKKTVTFFLILCMLLTFVACNNNESTEPESTTPQITEPKSTEPKSTEPKGTEPESTEPENVTPDITVQEVYEAGKSLAALLGDHENVYVKITSGGAVIREEYLSKQYCYSYYSAEFMNIGFEYSNFATADAEYYCFDNVYALNVTLEKSGVLETTDLLELVGNNDFISSDIVDDENVTITQKDGLITVVCTADPDEVVTMGDDIVSCVETYTLDAKTREMTEIKTVYTYEDGSIEEGISVITRDVEAPDGMKPYLEHIQKTDMRTVTVVSNPGTDDEKTDTVQVPKGLQVAFSAEFFIEETYTLYTDASCTQPVEDEWDVNADFTVYVKWNEQTN